MASPPWIDPGWQRRHKRSLEPVVKLQTGIMDEDGRGKNQFSSLAMATQDRSEEVVPSRRTAPMSRLDCISEGWKDFPFKVIQRKMKPFTTSIYRAGNMGDDFVEDAVEL
ncbi:hypothetical protein MRX96_026360 [Rhipicephalus microplus]